MLRVSQFCQELKLETLGKTVGKGKVSHYHSETVMLLLKFCCFRGSGTSEERDC